MKRRSRRLRRRARAFPRTLSAAVLLLTFILLLKTSAPSVQPLPLAPNAGSLTVAVYLTDEERICRMDLDAYICRVVAAEMPASFHEEALRAQAVASRSYACFRLRASGGSGCASHPDADVCTSSGCCQAYLPLSADERIARAVYATSGEVLLYGGQVINALYHASSGGQTANAETVFSEALPYLRSVRSPGEETYPQYAAESSFTREHLSAHFDLDDALPLSAQFQVLETDESGRAAFIRAGRDTFSGVQFRKILSLPSARMQFSFDGDAMTVFTTGFGHGVGLSQTGADAMARRGADYREILRLYYTDCEIGPLPGI